MRNVLYIDTETFSELDIKKVGTVKYAESAQLLLCGFKLNDQYEYYDFEYKRSMPDWAVNHIINGGKVAAHNALFDYLVLQPYMPFLKLGQMVDTMAICGAYGLPLSLDKAGVALHLKTQKYGGGSRLITKFCKPRKPTKHNTATRNYPEDYPSDWLEFRDVYLKADIDAVEELHDKLGDIPELEQQYWEDTQNINLAGIPIDQETVQHIRRNLAPLVDKESTEFIRITGLFPTQRDRVLEWVREQGVKCLNLQAATVEEILSQPHTPEHVKKALVHRANTAHMSFKKYDVMDAAIMGDGTIKGTLMYHVGHTGRWGGRLLQPQNLTKGNIDGVEAVARIHSGEFSVDLVKSSVRPMIHHPDGFTISDYSNIEARIVQWLCKDENALEVFRQGIDPYIWMAAKIYRVPLSEVTPTQRFCGKQAILGLAYNMSARKLIEMVESYGETIEPLEAKLAVDTYRNTHKHLVRFWRQIQGAAVMAIQKPNDTIVLNDRISFFMDGDFLKMQLPSGRCLAYHKPEVVESYQGNSFSYMGINDRGQYVRTKTYGGKLTENAVQAIARDILAHGVRLLLGRNYRVATHIHDEVVVIGTHEPSEINNIICTVPGWAHDIPLKAEGFNSPRFKKG